MALIGFKNVSLAFVGPMLLDGVDLQIEDGERVGLLGRNGAGKSTLLKILGGRLPPDSGDVMRQQGLRTTALLQDVPGDLEGTVGERLQAALAESGVDEGWQAEQRIGRIVSRLVLDPEADLATLSAGSKRRALLGAALVADPHLLLLDEPTNHLDIETIARVEDMILRRKGALVFVTHDRAFLRRVATRILDLDRGKLRSYDCNYDTYLERRDATLEAEAEEQAQFDKKLAKEEEWLRRGMKARRARNMGRVRALKAMRDERRERRDEVGSVRARLQEAERSGRIVMRTEDLTYGYDETPVVKDLTTTILRGDRIGIMGPNGCGKTTLLKLLLEELEPQAGTVRHGTKVETAVFDQLHGVLDESKTVQENVGQGSDTIRVGGVNRHIMGYLQDFLFEPEQIRGPVSKLSGGERNRLQLACILAKPCNVLILDEPTNDLDLETLEVLEGMLLDFAGTLLVVSHDRDFLDNVVTSTLVFEGDGRVKEYDGGYEDWLRQRAPDEASEEKKAARAKKERPAKGRPRRLTWKEQQELETLPQRIEELEAAKEEVTATLSDPNFYKGDGAEIAATNERLKTVEADLATAYERWEALESIAENG